MEYTLLSSAAASSSFSSLYCFNLNKNIDISKCLSKFSKPKISSR